jgi:hypothetical protein
VSSSILGVEGVEDLSITFKTIVAAPDALRTVQECIAAGQGQADSSEIAISAGDGL